MKVISKSDIKSQEKEFIKILKTNLNIKYLLENIKFPENLSWYLVGGCVNQTIWNFLTDRNWDYGINDYDLFYWDNDLSEDKEKAIQENVVRQLSKLNCEFDVVNQARVYEWFNDYFGVSIPKYIDIENSIATLPSTVTCIGVTKINNKLTTYAPFGLSDILLMKLRYNFDTYIPYKFISPKIAKWMQKWPELKVIKNSYPNE